MTSSERDVYVRRWSKALNRIGIPRLLSLPKPYKERLINTTDLIGKTLLLEEIATWWHK